MDSSLAGWSLDYNFLDSLEWSEENDTLGSFLDQSGSSLPHVVKVLEGFCGDAHSRTLDSGQILILHSLHKETKLLAQDAEKTDLFIPKNFQVKVEMIPKNSFEVSKSVRELLQTFPKYFRALDDIPSHDIISGSMFKIIRQTGYEYFECLQITNSREERRVKLPFSLTGSFQALQDNREFFIDEVYAEEKENIEAGLPVNVHFVKSAFSGISVPGLNVESLYDLGTLRLLAECETQTVFASALSSEKNKTLAIFPRDLEITVRPVKASEHYNSLRQAIKKTQLKILKRIERLNKLSLYKARNPIRQFSHTELPPPAIPFAKTRTQSELETRGANEVVKTSNSTPSPLSPKKPLKQTRSMPAVKLTGDSDDQNTKDGRLVMRKGKYRPLFSHVKQRPNYKPPAVPHQTEPSLPPKEKSNELTEDKNQILTFNKDLHGTRAIDQQGQGNDEDSPPIPPPRLRRRQKSSTKTKDVVESVDPGYEQMDGLVGQEYEYMDGSWMSKPNGTLEEIFGDIIDDGKGDGTTLTSSGDKTSIKINELAQRNDKAMVVLPDNEEQRERTKSVDYENTKELKLIHSQKKISREKVLPDNEDEQRERANSIDYENTKELKLIHSQKKISREKVLPDNEDEQRERANSIDYENTKELKLIHSQKTFSREKVLPDNEDEQRERANSVDYENTEELKLLGSNFKAVVDNINKQNKRTYGDDTPELVASRKEIIGAAGLIFDTSEVIPRTSSIDYENTEGLKPKIPLKKKHKEVLDKLDRKSQDDTGDFAAISQLSSPCNTDKTTSINDHTSFNLESTSGSSCDKSVSKTEQFLKDRLFAVTFPSEGYLTTKVYDTKEESFMTNTQDTSDGIYYTSMAENVAIDPSYINIDQNISLLDEAHLQNDPYDDTTYMPMDHGSNVESDLVIYENEISNKTEYDSDNSNYELVDSIQCKSTKTSRKSNENMEQSLSTDVYEEVDVIQQIESHTYNNKSTNNHETMDTSLLDESICRSQGDDSYEEVDPPLKPGSNLLKPTPKARTESENSYKYVDSSTDAVPNYFTKKISNDISAPPTPPQRRKRLKSVTGHVEVDDKTDKAKVLSSSRKRSDGNPTEDFQELESVQLHLAIKESERQILFDKVKALSQKEASNSVMKSQETSKREREKDANKLPLNMVSGKHVKRPPAPPPRKPINYLDVEPKGNPEFKPFKKNPTCTYSEIIGNVKRRESSKDDMEYVDDIELHYFQKAQMEIETKRKERDQSKGSNIDKTVSTEVKSMNSEEDYEEVDSWPSSEPETKEYVYLEKLSPTQHIDSNKETDLEIPKKLALKPEGSKKPYKPPKPQTGKKPIIKKPLRTPPKPMISQHQSHGSNILISSQHSSHDTNKPIAMHSSEKPIVPKKPLTLTPQPLIPPPKPKRTFEAEFSRIN